MMGPSSEDGEYGLLANSFRPGERVDDLPITMNMAGDTADDVDHDRHPQRVGVGSWLAHTDREIIKMEQDLYQPCSTEVVEGQQSAMRQQQRSALTLQPSSVADWPMSPLTDSSERWAAEC